MSDTPDRVRERLIECAEACLTHIRVVRFGEAVARYTVADGDRSLDVMIRVACYHKVEPKP